MFNRQKLLEEEMVALGVKRFRKETIEAKRGKHEATTPAGIQFIRKSCSKVSKAIDEIKKKSVSGDPLNYSLEAISKLNELPSDVMAFLALKGCINHLSTPVKLVKVAQEIGSFVEDEARFREFREANPALFDVVRRDLNKRTTNYRKQKRVLVHSGNKANIQWNQWSPAVKVKLGELLIEMVCSSTKIFAIKKHTRDTHNKRKTIFWLEATEEAIQWIEGKNSLCELWSPVKLPCVIPPRKWTSVYDGGYYQYTGLNLVKTMDQGYMNLLDAKHDSMKEVFHAVNTIQETAWRVSTKVLEVMDILYDQEAICNVIPDGSQATMPRPYPKGGTKEEIIEWKREATLMHGDNVRRKTKRIQFSHLMWMTRKFKDEKAIYFPHTLDFRGRLYANTAFLNPQGEDSARGLLEFTGGKPIGENGYAWLQIHLSNCWGYDKVSLEERVEWTKENEDMIMRVGLSPLDNKQWMEADKPWQFLRACFEYLCCNGNLNYLSHLPVTVDGSCNGLQHFSALLKDEVGGKATNLLPSDSPEDIYEIVRQETIRKICSEFMPDTDVELSIWGSPDNLSRALVKRPVMTTPYGATRYGMIEQIHEELKKQIDKGVVFPGIDAKTDLWKHCKFLAKHIYETIGEVVISSRQGMAWLQAVSKEMSRNDMPISWTVPTGFIVKQKYTKSIVKEIKTVINGRMASLWSGQGDSDKLDKAKQSNGIAPNFIHSLDACHLMKTIIKAKDLHDISSFSVVHDSFGVHACDIETLGSVLREEFVSMYEVDLLNKFRDEQKISLPSLPEFGILKIEEVKQSDFFFS